MSHSCLLSVPIFGVVLVASAAEPSVTIPVGDGDTVREYTVLPKEQDHVKAFGVRRSVPYRRGLAILEGVIFAPPVTVERHGLEILINNVLVRKAAAWPLTGDPTPENDPGQPPVGLPALPPEGPQPAEEKAAEAWFKYWKAKYRWLKREQAGADRALASVAELLRRQPHVTKVEVVPGLGLRVADDGGQQQNLRFVDYERSITVADLARQVQEAYQRFVEIFAQGGLFIRQGPLEWSGADARTWQALAVALSDQPEERRLARLAELSAIPTAAVGAPELRKLMIDAWEAIRRAPYTAATRKTVAEAAVQ